ncbi:MAG: lysylphosphatidylglycerol synthase transmembrane domain-containing protein [Anaerolineae bacterium]
MDNHLTKRGSRVLPLLVRLLALLALGGACVWISLRNVSLPDLWQSLLQAQGWWLVAAVFSVVVVAVAKTVRWWYLYPVGKRPATWMRTFDVLMTSQTLNLLIPVRLGEVARVGLMLQEGIPAPMTISTLVIEKSVELLAAGTLVALAIPTAVLPEWLPSSFGFLSGIGGAIVLIALFIMWMERRRIADIIRAVIGFRGWLPDRWQERIVRGVHSMLEGLEALANPRAALPIVLLTSLSWIASIFTIAAVLSAYGLSVGWHVAFSLSLALYLSNVVPTPPALVGVVSAVTTITLGWFGITHARSAAVGLALNVVLVAPVTLLGGWFTWYRFSHLANKTFRERWGKSLGLPDGDRVA